jgi:hypothetical protein
MKNIMTQLSKRVDTMENYVKSDLSEKDYTILSMEIDKTIKEIAEAEYCVSILNNFTNIVETSSLTQDTLTLAKAVGLDVFFEDEGFVQLNSYVGKTIPINNGFFSKSLEIAKKAIKWIWEQILKLVDLVKKLGKMIVDLFKKDDKDKINKMNEDEIKKATDKFHKEVDEKCKQMLDDYKNNLNDVLPEEELSEVNNIDDDKIKKEKINELLHKKFYSKTYNYLKFMLYEKTDTYKFCDNFYVQEYRLNGLLNETIIQDLLTIIEDFSNSLTATIEYNYQKINNKVSFEEKDVEIVYNLIKENYISIIDFIEKNSNQFFKFKFFLKDNKGQNNSNNTEPWIDIKKHDLTNSRDFILIDKMSIIGMLKNNNNLFFNGNFKEEDINSIIESFTHKTVINKNDNSLLEFYNNLIGNVYTKSLSSPDSGIFYLRNLIGNSITQMEKKTISIDRVKKFVDKLNSSDSVSEEDGNAKAMIGIILMTAIKNLYILNASIQQDYANFINAMYNEFKRVTEEVKKITTLTGIETFNK